MVTNDLLVKDPKYIRADTIKLHIDQFPPLQSMVVTEQSSTLVFMVSDQPSILKERISTSHGSRVRLSMMSERSLGILPV